MTTSFKKKLIGITATVVAFGAVFGAIYYVNFVYLPGKQQAATVDIATTEPAAPKEYHYTVSTANAQAASSTDTNPGELDTSAAAPGAPSANIDSGGEKITGADGAYHGEQPVATAPTSKPASTTTPSSGTNAGTAASKPANSKPSSGTTNKPTKTAPSEKPSTPSKPSSSTPKDGDIRTENGKQQEYVDGFGWVDVGDGGHTDYIEMGPDEALGEICENASFG